MDELKTLETMGFSMPTPAYLAGMIVFSLVGYAAYRYGKKTSTSFTKWIGVVLMLYPYVVTETWLMYGVGAGLCISLYMYRGK